MTIAEAREKCKNALTLIPRDVLIITIIFLASSASFGLGLLAGLDMGQGRGLVVEEESVPPAATSGQVVASKNGTKYYLPNCVGAERISDANKVWFASIAAAAKAGYAPAANCKGL